MPDHRAEPPFRLHRLRASVHELMLKLKELQGQKKGKRMSSAAGCRQEGERSWT